MPRHKEFPRLTFREAAKRWTADREPDLAIESAKSERGRAAAINRVLGGRKVGAITPEEILSYIRNRKAVGISNATVNRELDVVRGVLKRSKRWHRFADEVKPLKKTETIGRALMPDEKIRLLTIAATRPSWESAYFAAILALNTTCHGCELKGIRWRDIDFLNGTVTIQCSKTDAGHRIIPLNRDAMEIITAMHRRAERLGEVHPNRYLFSPANTATLTRPSRKKLAHGMAPAHQVSSLSRVPRAAGARRRL